MEQDQKDIVIAQLKAENFEYRQKEKDYNSLHKALLDLEHRYKLLQEEKNRTERDSRDRDELSFKKNDSLQSDIRVLNASIDEKRILIKDLNSELLALKDLTNAKNLEISRVKHELEEGIARNNELKKSKRHLEDEWSIESDKKKNANIEIDRLNVLNDELSKAEADVAGKAKDNELEIYRLSKRIDELNGQITDTEEIKKQKEIELRVTFEDKENNQKEIDRLLLLNDDYAKDNKSLDSKSKELEYEILKVNKRLDSTFDDIGFKDKDLKQLRAGLSYAQEKGYENKEQIKKVQKDNEFLQSLLEKYRGDIDFQRRLRNEEVSKKIELEQEKKLLEREVMSKQLEAHSAKKELEKIQDVKERLLDDHYQMNQELGALKDHAGLLESQNKNVNNVISNLHSYTESLKLLWKPMRKSDRSFIASLTLIISKLKTKKNYSIRSRR